MAAATAATGAPISPQHRLCGVVEESAARARERRAHAGPQPWIVLKLAVFITAGIISYACYVYIGRVCVPMIRRSGSPLAGRAVGIVFLCVFCPLMVMIIWSYAMIVFIPPGSARDVHHVQRSQRPAFIGRSTFDSDIGTGTDTSSIRGPSYETMQSGPAAHTLRTPTHLRLPSVGPPSPTLYSTSPPPPPAPVHDVEKADGPREVMHAGHLPIEGARVAFERTASARTSETGTGRSARIAFERTASSSSAGRSTRRGVERTASIGSASWQLHEQTTARLAAVAPAGMHDRTASAGSRSQRREASVPDAAADDRNAGVLDALATAPQDIIPSLPAPNDHPANEHIAHGQPQLNGQLPSHPGGASKEASRTPGYFYSRRPSTTPVLLSEYRFCARDELVKPFRAHHCRLCGTCILRYDHHCPWIGQCVGARNHRYFVLFLGWAFAFCIWTFTSLLALNIHGADGGDIDPQHIAIIALAGLFSLFTAALLATHINLITMNQTTVEALGVSEMRERERAGLGRMFAWYQFGEKRRTRKQWDEEWGRPAKEGNLWWLGGARRNWESVMGPRALGWILPILQPTTDGLDYPINPRFDAEGRWRPRREWPVDLQGT